MEEIEVKELIKHGNYNIIKICTPLALFLIFLIAKYGHRHYSYNKLPCISSFVCPE